MFKVLTLILAFSGIPIMAAAEEVDVEFLLAADISGSMDMEEARVQRLLVDALTHPDFVSAVKGDISGG